MMKRVECVHCQIKVKGQYTYSNVEVSDISQIFSIFNLSKSGRLYSDKRLFISFFQNVF
jgi:hypothetical protein